MARKHAIGNSPALFLQMTPEQRAQRLELVSKLEEQVEQVTDTMAGEEYIDEMLAAFEEEYGATVSRELFVEAFQKYRAATMNLMKAARAEGDRLDKEENEKVLKREADIYDIVFFLAIDMGMTTQNPQLGYLLRGFDSHELAQFATAIEILHGTRLGGRNVPND